ncbi:hypothetical protein D3C80_1531700 [compost metagenome]
MAQQHPAHRGGEGRQAAADVQIYGHDAFGRGTGDIQNIVAVQRGDRTGLIQQLADVFQHRLGGFRQRRGTEIGMGQRQDPWAQLKVFAVLRVNKPQLVQGIQATTHRSAWNAGFLADL